MGYRAARAAWVRLDLLVEALCTRGRWQRRTRRRRGHGASARSSPTWRWLRAAAQKRAASTRPRRAARWPRALQGELEGGVSRARAAVRTGRARLETRGAAGAAPAAQPSRGQRHARAIPRGIIITSLIPERSRWPSVAATIYSKRFSVRLRGKSRRAVGGWALACGAGVHTCSYGGERRRRWAPRHWQSNV